MKVLFVCSGNICRSPMAAEYFRARAAEAGLSHVVVDSAGTLGIVGAPASDEAIRVMRDIGIDLQHHRSKALTRQLLATTDLVVAMTGQHLDHLARHYPEGEDTRMVLRAFERGPRPAAGGPDLADPMGRPLAFYRELVPVLRVCLDHLVLYLKHRE